MNLKNIYIAAIHAPFREHFLVSPFAVYITVDKRLFSNSPLKARLFVQMYMCSFLR